MFCGSYVSGQTALKRQTKGAKLIDLRSPVQYRDQSIPGSVNMSLIQLGLMLREPRTTKIILIPDPADPKTFVNACSYLAAYGFHTVDAVKSIDSFASR